jgi:hypothetical protein
MVPVKYGSSPYLQWYGGIHGGDLAVTRDNRGFQSIHVHADFNPAGMRFFEQQ